jgi:TonB family protein
MCAERLSRQWAAGAGLLRKVGPARSCVLLAVIIAHGIFWYGIAHAPARVTRDGPPLLRASIAENSEVGEPQGIRSRAWQPTVIDTSSYPMREWHFPRTDIWPLTGGACPTPSEFGPLMDSEPATDEPRVPPKRASAQPQSTPKSAKPRLVLWLSPFYTMDLARTEMEGTLRLAFKIRSTGDTDEIEIERSSGSQKLDTTAAQAAKSWRFAPAIWQGQPIESKATVELTFNFFEYRVSGIDDEAISSASKRVRGRIDHPDRSPLIRKLVEELRTGATNELVARANANERVLWPAAMRNWGPTSSVQYLGPIGTPEWRRYTVKLESRAAKQGKTVVVRWELYRVLHDDNAALWEVGFDQTGGIWALKVEPLETIERANKSAKVCPG